MSSDKNILMLNFQLSKDCKYLQTVVYLEIGAERFSCAGSVILDPGYLAVLPWKSQEDDILPEFKRDQTFNVSEVIY